MTLLSGFRLPWPLSCCLWQPSPLIGSDERPKAPWLNVWFIPQHQFCLQKCPSWCLESNPGPSGWASPAFNPFKVIEKVEDVLFLRPLVISLTRWNFLTSPSYSEGNFGGNQLLDGLINLSPLYPAPTINLYIRIATDFHQSFLRLFPSQA